MLQSGRHFALGRTHGSEFCPEDTSMLYEKVATTSFGSPDRRPKRDQVASVDLQSPAGIIARDQTERNGFAAIARAKKERGPRVWAVAYQVDHPGVKNVGMLVDPGGDVSPMRIEYEIKPPR